MTARDRQSMVASDGTDQKPPLLYLSPIIPSLHGNGLAMRAGMVLQLLAARYRVYLSIRPLYPAPVDTVPTELANLCTRMAILPPVGSRAPQPGIMQRAAARITRRSPPDPFGDVPFSVVHVFRLVMVDHAGPYCGGTHPPERHLDLDDLESQTQQRLAALYRRNGDRIQGILAEAQAQRARADELEVLQTWDRVYVCSDADRRTLLEGGGCRVEVLPNAVRLPAPFPGGREPGPFTMLFVGTLGYYPNEDALRYFCHEVLPAIRRKTSERFRVIVVGFGAGPSVEALTEIPEVELAGSVPDVSPWYRAADVVVVPVRAGGGTRIKVLEAFAYRRAVVSTTLGCEGISVCDGQHVLLADTPQDLAEKCLHLMRDPELRARLGTQAHALVRARYTLEAVARDYGWNTGA